MIRPHLNLDEAKAILRVLKAVTDVKGDLVPDSQEWWHNSEEYLNVINYTVKLERAIRIEEN